MKFIAEPTLDSIYDELSNLAESSGSEATFAVLLGEQKAPALEDLVRTLQKFPAVVVGGLFPGLIHGARAYDQGALLVRLSDRADARVLGLDEILSGGLLPGARRNTKSAFVLMDGLSPRVDELLQALYDSLGQSVDVVGGGAGSLTLRQQPCLFDQSGAYQDAALVALSGSNLGLGIRHGWQVVHGPLVADQTSGNRIDSLNWQSPFQLYADLVHQHCGERPTIEGFFELSSRYPFGMEREGHELVVRDPISAATDGSIECVGGVPEHAVLSLLEGSAESLVQAARAATRQSLDRLNATANTAFVANCISRKLFLNEDFPRELESISDELPQNTPMWGVLSLGEVASSRSGPLAFCNKTVVVGTMHEV